MAQLPSYTTPRNDSKLKSFRPGYPRYTALLATHASFQNFRRFTRVRTRLLLLKQDEICRLEQSLDTIDSNEECELFLGCSRRDTNTERQSVLADLTSALNEYDSMLEKHKRVLNLPNSSFRDIQNLSNWTQSTSSISRQETAYLKQRPDLVNLARATDNALTWTEWLAEDCTIWLRSLFRRCVCCGRQRDSHKNTSEDLIFLPGPILCRLSRTLATWVTTLILLIPVVILYNLSNGVSRLITIILASGFFLSAVSVFTKAKTIELFIAGASYAAVLVVFTSSSNGLHLDQNLRESLGMQISCKCQ